MKLVFLDDGAYAYASGSPSAVGGAERYQWLLARAQAVSGWLVTGGVRQGLEPGERRVLDGVEFVGIGGGQILLAWYRFLLSERPDWWFWQTADHLWGPAVAIAKLAGTRTIFSAMHDRDVQPRGALFRRHRWWPLYAWGLTWTDKIFVQHAEQLSQLAPRLRSKASILPGMVSETAAVKPHSEREKYVAWIAMLRQPKRPDLLIEVAQKMPHIRFVVCGGTTTFMTPPGYGEHIVHRLRGLPNVDYLGQVAPEKTIEIISNAAILLSTSDEEGFPSVFLEAWSAGTPVVSLRIDPDHIIERERLGLISGNADRAITDINTLIDSLTQRDEIAARARRFIHENHSAPAVVKIFDRALRNGRP